MGQAVVSSCPVYVPFLDNMSTTVDSGCKKSRKLILDPFLQLSATMKTNSADTTRSKIPRIVLQKVGCAKFSKIFVQFYVSHEPAPVPDIFNLLFRYVPGGYLAK